MTSTFELVPAIPQVEEGKISSLSQWEDQIYIGTEDGQVLQYKIDEDKQNPGQYTFLQSRKRSLGKKKPVELHVFKDLLRIITICDGTVDLLHLVNLEITNTTIPQNKNVSLFCYEKKTHLFNFCVQVKKTLYLYEFVGNFQLIKEIKLPEPALSIEWWKGVLCLGYKKEFILMEAATGTTTPLFPLERSLPLCTLIGEDLLLAKDELGISVSHEGNPTRGAIAWSSPPTSIATGVTAPYVVALEPKGELLEFHNMLNQTLVQTLHCPGKKLFRLSYYEGSKYTLAAAPNSIYRIIIQPLEVQVERLLLQNKVTEAIQLVETVVQTDLREDAVKKLQNVHRLAGHVLLKNLQIEEAFQSFQQSNIEVGTLLAYFPDIVPQSYAQKTTPLIDFAKKVKGETGAEDAVEQAKTYLLEFLESKYKPDRTDLSKDINTSILKLYLNARETSLKVPRRNLLQSFLRKTNHFHTSEIEAILVERSYFTTLGILYQGIKENKKALQLWEKLGSKAIVDKGDEMADGIDQTVDLLSSIDTKESYVNSQLLWDYSKWVLLKDPYRGIKIFASKSHPTPLDPNQVVEYLSQMNPLLVQLYLEFLIFENNNKTPQHHTRLAILYVDAYRKLFTLKQENSEEGVKAKAKLFEILKKSQYYDESTLLGQIMNMPLYEEHIILYSRLRQHQKALEVIVTKFKDYRRAERYCTQFKQEDDELTLSLLKVYLQEPTVEGEFIPINALRLMNSHAFELNPTKVLPLLSNKTPISLLTEYLTRSIQHNHHMYRQNQVVKKLHQAEHLSTKYKVSYLTDKVITITRERACQVCNKPIGDRFFARYPSGTLVHFKCMKDPNVDPITGEDFKRKSKWT